MHLSAHYFFGLSRITAPPPPAQSFLIYFSADLLLSNRSLFHLGFLSKQGEVHSERINK